MKKWVKIILCVLLALLLLAGGYVAYVFIDYHRIGDQMLTPVQSTDAARSVDTNTAYTVVSWNIGFGAYEDDYGFFMDGGTESRAWSKERLTANMDAIAGYLKQQNADFCLLQEVDIGSTRTYHVDEREPLYAALFNKSSVFCQNYDSPYLLYPLTAPHGASRSGLLTFSPANITAADRVELPVESGFMKLLDLDRCYSVSRVPVSGGGELVLYDLHLSAYTSDGTIATEQLALLLADMQAEYEKGSWCVAGGDFNKDLLGTPPSISARRSRNIPGRSPYRRACSTAMTCSWWRHWTRTIRCPPAATPTVHTTTASMSSPWMASWSPPMLPWTVPLFWIQALPTPITTRYR